LSRVDFARIDSIKTGPITPSLLKAKSKTILYDAEEKDAGVATLLVGCGIHVRRDLLREKALFLLQGLCCSHFVAQELLFLRFGNTAGCAPHFPSARPSESSRQLA